MAKKVSVTGHIKVTLRHDDGRCEVVTDRPNQVTFLYLDRLTELISQLGTDPAAVENSINSLWVEASTIGVSVPTANDEVPDANAEIVAQKIFDDADIFRTTTGAGIRTVEFRTTIEGPEANGKKLVAACLFTRGSVVPPAVPGLPFTSGADNVFMVARQLIGPFDKLSGFAVDLDWAMTFQILDE